MKISKSFTTVTPLSKIIALILFVLLPFMGFYLGMQYQQAITVTNNTQVSGITQAPRLVTTTPAPTVIPRQFDKNRTVLSLKMATRLAGVKNGQCSLQLSESDSGIEWKEFSDGQVKFNYPYSLQWGNEQYQIMPIEPLNGKETTFFFGPMSVGIEGCGGALRSYTFAIEPNKTLADIKLATPEDEIKSYQINSYHVTEYIEASGIMSTSRVYFEGKNKLYRFDMFGNTADDPNFQTIIRSFHIL